MIIPNLKQALKESQKPKTKGTYYILQDVSYMGAAISTNCKHPTLGLLFLTKTKKGKYHSKSVVICLDLRRKDTHFNKFMACVSPESVETIKPGRTQHKSFDYMKTFFSNLGPALGHLFQIVFNKPGTEISSIKLLENPEGLAADVKTDLLAYSSNHTPSWGDFTKLSETKRFPDKFMYLKHITEQVEEEYTPIPDDLGIIEENNEDSRKQLKSECLDLFNKISEFGLDDNDEIELDGLFQDLEKGKHGLVEHKTKLTNIATRLGAFDG